MVAAGRDNGRLSKWFGSQVKFRDCVFALEEGYITSYRLGNQTRSQA
jgi:hypothetical protein